MIMVKDLAPDMAALIGCWCSTMLYGKSQFELKNISVHN